MAQEQNFPPGFTEEAFPAGFTVEGEGAPKPPAARPAAPPQPSAMGFAQNIVTSAGDLVYNTLKAGDFAMRALVPGTPESGQAGAAVVTGLKSIVPGTKESHQVGSAIVDALKNRYGSIDNILRTLYTDPVGVVGDLATLYGGLEASGVKLPAAKLTVSAPKIASRAAPAVQEAVRAGQAAGVPVDLATATGNRAVAAAQHIADRSIGGSLVAERAAGQTAEALTARGEALAARARPGGAVAPEQAGAGVSEALAAKVAKHREEANTAYDRLRELEQDPSRRMTMPGPKKPVDALEDSSRGQLRRIVHELDASGFTPRVLQPAAKGGGLEHVAGTGGAGAKVWDDIVQRAGSGATRGLVQKQLEEFLGGGPRTKIVDAALDVAEERGNARGGYAVSLPELPPSAMEVPTRLEPGASSGLSRTRPKPGARPAPVNMRNLTEEEASALKAKGYNVDASTPIQFTGWNPAHPELNLPARPEYRIGGYNMEGSSWDKQFGVKVPPPPTAAPVEGAAEAAKAAGGVDMGLPVNLGDTKDALRPLYEQMKRQMPITQQQANPGLKALENIINSEDWAPLSQVDRDLSAIKSIAREQGGIAKVAVAKLEAAVQTAAEAGGPEVQQALKSGREATIAKYATADVLEQLRAEPVQTFRKLTWAKDAGVEQLRKVAKQVPDAVPLVGRAYLEDLLGMATAEGGFKRADKLFADWQKLGPETKKILYGDPLYVRDLDRFFLLAKKLAENPNPSGTGHIVSMGAQGGLLLTNPIGGGALQLGAAALSGLMHSPRFVKAITNGLTMELSTGGAVSAAGRARASAEILKAAEDAGVKLSAGTGPAAGQQARGGS